MEIKILGSVSPYCKDNKNCPGYLITTDNSKILLDCGNGITRNMNLPDDLNNLTIIISHLHKDHYGDLLSLAYASYVYHNLGYLDKPITVYLPETEKIVVEKQIGYWADGWIKYGKVEEDLIDYSFLTHLGEEHYMKFKKYDEYTNLKIDNLKISFSKNPHQINTYSTKIKENSNIFVYSADTGFKNNSLIKLAKNADILICESTYLKGQTKSKDYHLYAYEAAIIAKEANVKELVLTHFWPEIDSNEYVSEAKEIFKNTSAAKECKILKLGGINGK